jgi:hypothetical protein
MLQKHYSKIARTAPIALAVALAGLAGSAGASGGGSGSGGGGNNSGTWPTAYPLNPGTVISQTATTAAVRSTSYPYDVMTQQLDPAYTAKGCQITSAVNHPRMYLCYNPNTKKTDTIDVHFAALDPTATDPSVSQTSFFLIKG